MTTPERCDWSDLWPWECAHCGPQAPPPAEVLDELLTDATVVFEISDEPLTVESLEAAVDLVREHGTPRLPPIDHAALQHELGDIWEPMTARLAIASDLAAITDCFARLRSQTYYHPTESGDDVLGGTAMSMLGPRADIEAWGYVQISAKVGRLHLAKEGNRQLGPGDKAYDVERAEILNNSPEPPLSWLAGWVDIIRRERGHDDGPVRATITTEAGYISDAIDWITNTDSDGNSWWIRAEEFTRALHEVRLALDHALGLTDQIDSGAPCRTCQRPLLRIWGIDPKDDRWYCEVCLKWIDPKTYKLAVLEDVRQHKLWLTAKDMHEEYRIPIGTLYVWAHRGKVRKRKDARSGRTVYNVGEALEQRDTPHDEATPDDAADVS